MLSLNGTELEFKTYPNGEQLVPRLHPFVHADLTPEKVFFRWDGDVDLVRLLFVLDYLHQHRFPIDLEIAYMPYSRMDRLEGGPEWEHPYACALSAAAGMIRDRVNNYVRAGSITVWDPHSQATLDALGATPIYPAIEMFPALAKQVGFDPSVDYVVLPDKGAVQRYSALVKDFDRVITLEKKRNYDTGRIDHMGLTEDAHLPAFWHGHPPQAIILDDLCSYGGTFVKAADLLKSELGFTKVHLLVTHLEPACMKGELFDHVDTVWGSDSLMDKFPRRDRPHNPLYIYTKEEWKK